MPEPNRPAITPASIVAILIAGVPAIANLLAAFDVYVVTAAQQHALTEALTWGGILAGLLLTHDAVVRTARNKAHAQVAAATARPAAPAQPVWTSVTPNVATSGTTYTSPIVWSNPSAPAPEGDADALPDVPTTPADQVAPDEGDAGNTP